ncbi:MAG TPA: hypothetical protein VLE93_02770 [Candidatus Saccharimonadales bacterium]|nr:hypothetical protein [Candidatus Saccharimonadales bacterium]
MYQTYSPPWKIFIDAPLTFSIEETTLFDITAHTKNIANPINKYLIVFLNFLFISTNEAVKKRKTTLIKKAALKSALTSRGLIEKDTGCSSKKVATAQRAIKRDITKNSLFLTDFLSLASEMNDKKTQIITMIVSNAS